ncbi:TCP-1/cpn60 chaperonin family protein [Halococcus salifodinae]|uniref:Thermosome n=1 Tax=Halococcus salifodinae DSM 8989 TaxID=1227456 RepID=M0N8I0_9EURY|nr:TCP-1/cpn60 chaperonin family protein [Halococcus salifodinae]EMA54267.1 thermosome [Halococcus salifodinae DSM 8989]
MADESGVGLAGEVRTLCDVIRTALGPFGANKLLVGADGNVQTTASSTELLNSLEVDDPAVTLVSSTATGFRERHGDGAGSVVALVGALLAEAERLRERGLHPTAIEQGYRTGLETALTTLDRTARSLDEYGPSAVARIALTGTRDPSARGAVADQVAAAVERIGDEVGSGDAGPGARDAIQVVSRTGGAAAETELVEGVVLDRNQTTPAMPRTPDRRGVAVLSSTVDVPTVGTEMGRVSRRVDLDVDSFEEREAVADYERSAFAERLDAAVEAGCGAVFTGQAINERVENELAARDVLGVERLDADELRRIARTTGTTVVPTLEQVTTETLGDAAVRVERKAGRDMTFVTDGAGETVYTLFCRAPDPRSATAFERSVESAVAAAAAAVRDGRVVPGGGAAEATAAEAVRREARSIPDRSQFAAEAFGDALMTVPRALGRTAGMDAWEAEVRLRVARSEGRDAVGVDALVGTTRDVLAEDAIVDPLPIRRATLTAATELATQLVRIDERLPATDLGDDAEDQEEMGLGPAGGAGRPNAD